MDEEQADSSGGGWRLDGAGIEQRGKALMDMDNSVVVVR